MIIEYIIIYSSIEYLFFLLEFDVFNVGSDVLVY